jgi:hypothetical protein
MCDFGSAVGRASATLGGAPVRGLRNESAGEVLCAVPPTSLLGDLRLRISHDGGARWSALSPEPLTCHDSASAPTPLSAAQSCIDVASVAYVTLRAANLRRLASAPLLRELYIEQMSTIPRDVSFLPPLVSIPSTAPLTKVWIHAAPALKSSPVMRAQSSCTPFGARWDINPKR